MSGQRDSMIPAPFPHTIPERFRELRRFMADKTPSGPHDGIYCAFCGKVPEQVNAMISGPNGIFICDECISVSVDAMLTDLSMRGLESEALNQVLGNERVTSI